MKIHVNRGGVPCGGSMYEFLGSAKGYDAITLSAMEVVLEQGADALMHQLSYADIEFLKEFPTVYKRAIELGIIELEEGDEVEEEEDEE